MKRKLISLIFAFCLFLPGVIMMSGCGDDAPENVTLPTYELLIKSENKLSDKLENLEVLLNNEDSNNVFDNGIDLETQIEEGTDLLIRMTTKQSYKYSVEDVVVTEANGKEMNEDIQIKSSGLTQNIIEIAIDDIKDTYAILFDLKDSGESFVISSMIPEFDYRISSNGNRYQTLEKDFEKIAIWSDVSQHFVSLADVNNYNHFLDVYNLSSHQEAIEKYENLLSLEPEDEGYIEDLENVYVNPEIMPLGLTNINTSDFKVYVSFGDNLIKFKKEVLSNLLVLRDTSGEKEDVSFTFNPVTLTKNGSYCYEFVLEKEKLGNLVPTSTIALKYVQELENPSASMDTEQLRLLAGYYNTEGYKFSNSNYVLDLTNEVKIDSFLRIITKDEIVSIDEDVQVGLNLRTPDYINVSKLDIYLGNTDKKIKATYAPTGTDFYDYTHIVTIPAHTYPSELGNAEYFFFTMSPNVESVDEVLNTDGYVLLKKTTEVKDVLMHDIYTENDYFGDGDRYPWRTELSQDKKTFDNYIVIKSETENCQSLNIAKRFYYTYYNAIKVEVEANGLTFKLNIDFKEIFDDLKSSNSGFIAYYVGISDLEQDVHNCSREYISDTAHVIVSAESNYVQISNINFMSNFNYSSGAIVKITDGTLGKVVVKGYSYFDSYEDTSIVDTNLKIMLGDEEITPNNGEYLLDVKTTYNFELTINESCKPSNLSAFTSYYNISHISFSDGEFMGSFDSLDINYEVINNKIIGTICINACSHEHSAQEIDYIGLGISYCPF